ncbi:MAG: DUF4962 domain-containing protein [Armatimonadia bacterium]
MTSNRQRAVFWASLGLFVASFAHAQAEWDFEDAKITWRPRSDTVKLTRMEGQDRTGQGKACLRVAGAQQDGWNYASSERQPMTAGQLYRLSAWVKVDRLPEGTAAPSLKCEFQADDPREVGRVVTNTYDARRLGQWQELSITFRAMAGTTGYWLAVEKGGNAPMAIDLLLDDVTVEPADATSILKQYGLTPMPAPLVKYKGTHPRMYLNAARVAALREAVKTTHAAVWQECQAMADRLAKNGPPKYVREDKYSGEEQLWQREVGNAMPTLALAYVVTGDQKYLDSARAWALASCGYETWGLGRIDGMDLATGHQLFGLGIVYDWCYEGLGEEARRTIRETLVRRAGGMAEAAACGQAWWQKSYMQNHLWVNAAGLAAAGFAIYDEEPEAALWIGLPLDKFKRTMEALGPDGASHEGVGYWQYGVEYMLKFMWLARDLLDVDLFSNDWWRNTARYALYFQLPRNAWAGRNCIVDIADCPRTNWYGPDYMLRLLATEYQDPYAQWLASEVDAANISAAGAPWLNVLWHNAALAPKPPTDLPTLRHFEDMGLVSARSDWSGDESMVVFKCGPFIGHKAVQEFDYDPGGGHVHPDANHFLIFGGGEWLIRDDGYASKMTAQHNTLLVDGKGQMGEAHWFSGAALLRLKAYPKVEKAASQPALDHIVGDATAAYAPQSGLKKYRRHLLFVKPNVLLVLDDIQTDKPSKLELRFHPEQKTAEADGNAFVCKSEKMALRVEPLTLDGVTASAENTDQIDRNNKALPMFTIRLQAEKQAWRNATALSWCKAGEEPVKVSVRADGDRWTFTAGQTTVLFVWDKETAAVK